MPDYEMKFDTEDEGSEKQMDGEGDAALDENNESESFGITDLRG